MCDLLPQSVHAYLQEAETYVALPVLIILGLCTVQLVFCQVTQVATCVAEICRRRAECRPKCRPKKCPAARPCPSLLERLAGMFCTREVTCAAGGAGKKIRSVKRTYASMPGNDDWDDEFDDDEELDDVVDPPDDE